MADFKQAFQKVIGNEGGYSNDPDDSGGETNYGISKKSYPGEDIKNLTIDRAREIYKADYWDKINGDLIASQKMAESIFDFAVNAGIGTSAELAQKVVKVDIDGSIGKNTVAKLNITDPEYFVAAFTIEKIRRYIDICNKRPESRKYFFGWVTRAINA